MRELKCFVMMPFGKDFDDVYQAMRKAGESRRFGDIRIVMARLDDSKVPVWLNEKLKESIDAAELCIADLTDSNPNVMWETGYAMRAGKHVIALTQEVGDLPFNLRPYRMLQYSRHRLDTMTKTLRDSLAETVPTLAAARALPLDEEAFLRYLLNEVPTPDQRALIAQFKDRGSILTRFFLTYHREPYRRALHRALNERRLKLNSQARRLAAKEAIGDAVRSVRAIAVLRTDRWSEQKAYSLLIRAVAPRLKQWYRRIIVYDGRINAEQKALFRAEHAAGVEFRVVPRAVIDQIYGEREAPQIENVLIVDEGTMTHALPDSNHDGELVLSRGAVVAEAQRFDDLWDSLFEYQEDFAR